MDPSFWAGISLAETAGQIAFCGLLIAVYFLSGGSARRDRTWLNHALSSAAAAGVSFCVCLALILRGIPPYIKNLHFAGATLVFVFSIVAVHVPLAKAKLLSIALVLGLAVIGIASMLLGALPLLERTDLLAPRGGVFLALSPAGRILVALLAITVAISVAAMRQIVSLDRAERRCVTAGLTAIVVILLLDASGVGKFFGFAPVPMVTHVGLPFALMVGVSSLLRRKRVAERGSLLVGELAQCKEELSANHASLERMQRELGTKNQLAAVGELAAAIAHEVRNPLAIIMNAAAGLRRPTLQSEDRSTLLGILDEETARLNRLVTDLLRYARPVIIKRSSVSVVELVRRVQGRLDDSNVLSVEIPEEPDLRVVQADTNLLRLVFDNLVSNAFQAMPEGGTVKIAVSGEEVESARFVRIDIVDHGHGMDELVLARAVDPFYTTRPSGTGLGLPIVQRIVEAHGGRIEIDSAPGYGTKVSMFLPRLCAADLDASAASAVGVKN